jgi:drug/metabolite transporter (DMT)-like permease
MHKGVVFALIAAILFGASTPISKLLITQVAPVMLAGLLYLGSGIGLLVWFLVRTVRNHASYQNSAKLSRQDVPWLSGAILSGGIAAPIFLMIGLLQIPASTTSLLLNLEGVFTAALAWWVFNESFDRRIFIGMVFIVCAGILLSWDQRPSLGVPWGALSVTAACLCWAIDNNLTCKISANDSVQIAGIKGLVAGLVNISIALTLGLPFPELNTAMLICLIGFVGYGVSLVLFVLALRELGSARTGAYFSIAPFVGTIFAILIFAETPSALFWLALCLIIIGVWLHITEKHNHTHFHEPIIHDHEHNHDEHHQHTHQVAWDCDKPHSHPHQHEPVTHDHHHFPDSHHRHKH